MAHIASIQRFSLDDGPGIRTTVFFQGCNLRCQWCHNPETIPPDPVLRFQPRLCIGCGRCQAACHSGAHTLTAGVHALERPRCDGCGKCASACPAGALQMSARRYSARALFDEVARDADFFMESGGGVSFSGGECMLRPVFLARMLQLCGEAGIDTAVDTAGNVSWARFEQMLPHTGLFLYDIKLAGAEAHAEHTGADNARILDNFRRLCRSGARIWVRIPLVPGVHGGRELDQLAALLRDAPVERIELLPYHRHGEGKYTELGLDQPPRFDPPDDEFLRCAAGHFSGCAAPVRIK